MRLIEPSAYAPIPALQFVEREHLLDVERGPAWLVEVTLDGGRAGKVDDFRPGCRCGFDGEDRVLLRHR